MPQNRRAEQGSQPGAVSSESAPVEGTDEAIAGAEGPAAGDYPGTADQARADQTAPGVTPTEPALATGEREGFPTHNLRPDLATEDDYTSPFRGGTDATHGTSGLSDTLPAAPQDRESEEERATLVPGAGEPLPDNINDLPPYRRIGGVVNSASDVNSPHFARHVATHGVQGQIPALDPTPKKVSDLSEEERLRGGFGLSPDYFAGRTR